MNRIEDPEWQPQTQAIRVGHHPTNEGEHGEPIFTTSSFMFESAEQAAARFSGAEPGNIYARFTNPTTKVFEDRLAALEGGESCVATGSGMAAILSTFMALCSAGDEVVVARQVFGTTSVLFNKYLAKFGLEVKWVDLTDWSQWETAITDLTRWVFVESPSNPLTEVVDIARLAALAHKHGAGLIVDNCFCTPILQQPLALGADIVIHSATKFLDGQGRAIGGAVVGNKKQVGEEVRGFANLWTQHVAVQCLDFCKGPGNAGIAHEGPLHACQCRGRFSGGAPPRQARVFPRAVQPPTGGYHLPAADRPRCHRILRGRRRAGRRLACDQCHENDFHYGKSWRCQNHHHASGQHHARTAYPTAARRCGHS